MSYVGEKNINCKLIYLPLVDDIGEAAIEGNAIDDDAIANDAIDNDAIDNDAIDNDAIVVVMNAWLLVVVMFNIFTRHKGKIEWYI